MFTQNLCTDTVDGQTKHKTTFGSSGKKNNMKLRKTDRRFKLYNFGFDCYVEFDVNEWRAQLRYQKYCNNILGEQFQYFHNRVYTDGKYYIVNRHRKGNCYYKRIYFRGEKNHTLLLMGMP